MSSLWKKKNKEKERKKQHIRIHKHTYITCVRGMCADLKIIKQINKLSIYFIDLESW